mmetsp:Transcript_2507/g.3662  ORF Transcript_2507/g.3662 Transcript_2507/m.3662 type:complete len:218 (+) Transcript_2507:29-682(+)
MARGKGPKRGGGRRFAAESAEEIEQRNARLAEFDEQRAKHRAEAAEDGEGDDDSSEAMLVNSMTNNATLTDKFEDKDRKVKGLEGLIEVDNPNTQPVRMMKAKDLAKTSGPPDVTQMTRKQREEYEREQKAAAYRKRHEAGLTEEYRRDMAKLAEVKARREKQAEARKDQEEAEKKLEEERKKAAEAAGASGDGKKSKKKSSSSKKSGPPKLDKITI